MILPRVPTAKSGDIIRVAPDVGYAGIGQTADARCVVEEALGITDRTHEG